MEIKKGNLLIRTTNEGIDCKKDPATVEIIDLPSGATIYKIKAMNIPCQGADGGRYPFIIFEEADATTDTTKATSAKAEADFQSNQELMDQIQRRYPGRTPPLHPGAEIFRK